MSLPRSDECSVFLLLRGVFFCTFSLTPVLLLTLRWYVCQGVCFGGWSGWKVFGVTLETMQLCVKCFVDASMHDN